MKPFLFILLLFISMAGSGQQLPSQVQAKRGVFTERLFLKDRWIDKVSTDLNSPDSSSDNVLATGKAIADYTRLKGAGYIQNQNKEAQIANFRIKGTGILDTIAINKTAPVFELDVNGRFGVSDRNYNLKGFEANLAARYYVVHGANNWGFNITRAEDDKGGPNLSFYKTRNADASIRAPANVGDLMGRISFHAVSTDSTAHAPVEIQTVVDSVINSDIYGSIRFYTGNAGTSFAERMRISHYGRVGIGVGAPTGFLHLRPGTANNPSLMINAGTLTTTPLNGAIENDGTHLYYTSDGTRYQLDQQPGTSVLRGTLTYDFPAVTNNSSTTANITVMGAAVGDMVLISKTSAGLSNGETYTGFVSATNTVSIRLNNNSGGSFDLPNESYNIMVLKY
jgi:hypothetical protein